MTSCPNCGGGDFDTNDSGGFVACTNCGTVRTSTYMYTTGLHADFCCCFVLEVEVSLMVLDTVGLPPSGIAEELKAFPARNICWTW